MSSIIKHLETARVRSPVTFLDSQYSWIQGRKELCDIGKPGKALVCSSPWLDLLWLVCIGKMRCWLTVIPHMNSFSDEPWWLRRVSISHCILTLAYEITLLLSITSDNPVFHVSVLRKQKSDSVMEKRQPNLKPNSIVLWTKEHWEVDNISNCQRCHNNLKRLR